MVPCLERAYLANSGVHIDRRICCPGGVYTSKMPPTGVRTLESVKNIEVSSFFPAMMVVGNREHGSACHDD